MAKSFYSIIIDLEGDKKTKGGLEDIGKAAGLTGAALTAFSLASAKTAATYETSLAAVQTIATKATGSVDEFDSAVTDLSNDMKGALSINQAAAASYDILSSGYTKQSEVLFILEQSQKAAVGGFAELADVSDATTTILNSYGDALGDNLSMTDKVSKITDQMIQTQNLGKIVAGEYASRIGSVASTAAVAGISFEELNAAIAVSTANGVSAGSTFAGINQVLSQLSKPTGEATEQAAALGINFNAAALKSKGLSGVLKDIIASGGATTDSMFKLFGSVEAVKVAMTLVKNEGAGLDAAIAGMNNSVGAADKAFDTMSDTVEFKAQAALNKLNNMMVRLGQGALIAIAPVLEALSWLADRFNALPKSLQQAIGLATIATGVVLTLGGAILVLSASVTTMTAAWAAAAALIAGLSWATVTGGIAAMGGAALVAAPYLLAIAAAIGAVAASIEYAKNLEIEKEANKYLGALAATEELASKSQMMANRIRDTGEAVPEEEFQAFIEMLTKADAGTGTLAGQITALTNVQTKAKAGTLDMTEAELEATKATTQRGEQVKLTKEEIEALAKAEQEAYAAVKEQVTATQTILDSELQAKLANIELSQKSEEAALKSKLEAQKTALDETKANQQLLLDEELTTESERATIQSNLTQKLTEFAKEQSAVQIRLAEITKDKVMAQLSTQEARANLMFKNQQLSAGEYYEYLNQLLNDEKALKLGVLQEELNNSEKGTLEEAKALQGIAELDVEIADKIKANSDAIATTKIENINDALGVALSAGQTELAQQELLYKQGELSELQYLDFVKASAKEQTETKIKAINDELAVTEDGSRRYSELINERGLLEAQLGKDLIANEEAIMAAKIKAIKTTSGTALLELETRALKTKEMFDQGAISEQEYTELVKASIQEQTAIKIEAINEELAVGVATSEMAKDLINERTQLEIKMRTDIKAEEVKLFNLTLESIKQIAETQKAELQNQMGFFEVQADLLNNQMDLGGGLSSLLGNISSRLKDDNITLADRNQLEQVSANVLSQVKQLGLSINSGLTQEQQIQQAIAQLEVFKLGLKQKQLAVQRQLIQQESQVQSLELQANVTTAQTKIQGGGLTGKEVTQLQQEISLNQQKLELLNAQTQAKLEANAISSQLVGIERQVAQVGTAPVRLPDVPLATKGTGAMGVGTKGEDKTAQNTADISSSAKSLPNISTDLKSALNTVGTLSNSSLGVEQSLSKIGASTASNFNLAINSMRGIQNDTSAINNQLKKIETQLGGLPKAIANSMPRPPASTNSSR